MLIPKEIKTKNKIRDARICNMYVEDNLAPLEIAGQAGLSERQVSRILYKNRSVLNIQIDWEKIKQVCRIKRQISKKGDSKRDVLDLEKQLHEILTDGKLKVEHSGEVKTGEDKIIIIRPGVQKVEPVENRIETLPR